MASQQCGGCSGECSEKPSEDKLSRQLSKIGNKIVVLSGKGGVGKSTVAVNLAVGLSLRGKRVGLMDVDIHGPSVPRLLSLTGQKPQLDQDRLEPVQWSRTLSVISLGFLIPSPEEAVIWRGPVKTGLIRQFVEDVAWGELDYLVVDCPPGTGDEPLSVLQTLGQDAWALIVTTPQSVAIDDVRRSIGFCRQVGNPILGVVENMAGFVCPGCKEEFHIFDKGGGEELARESGVPFLGRIPIDPEIVRSGDEGYVFVKTHPESAAGKAMDAIIQPVLTLAPSGCACGGQCAGNPSSDKGE
jgi:ATP-binding protein involved in chromosome partitioning